jgi:hypothetical protein
MVVKTAPASAFVMAEPEFLFEFLVIAFNDPALFGDCHQILQFCCCRQRGEPVFGRLGWSFRPFHKQPFFRMWFGLPVVTMCRTEPQGGKAGAKFLTCPLSPRHVLPRLCRQRQRHLFYTNRLMIRMASQQSWWPAILFARGWR